MVGHGSSEGEPDFIYEYNAWSFLIFNKETRFTSLFLIFSFLFSSLIRVEANARRHVSVDFFFGPINVLLKNKRET